MSIIHFDKNSKEVDGPINVIRLQGKVDNIEKVIYLFMNEDVEVEEQLECYNEFSEDIQKYLAENFKEIRKIPMTFDFYFGLMSPHGMADCPSCDNYRGNYAQEIRTMLKKFFSRIAEENGDTISVSDYFKNVRLHFGSTDNYYTKFIRGQLWELIYTFDQVIIRKKFDVPYFIFLVQFIGLIRHYFEVLKQIISRNLPEIIPDDKPSNRVIPKKDMEKKKKTSQKKKISKKEETSETSSEDNIQEETGEQTSETTPSEDNLQEETGKQTDKQFIPNEFETELFEDNLLKIFTSYSNHRTRNKLSKQILLFDDSLSEITKKCDEILQKLENSRLVYNKFYSLKEDKFIKDKYVYGQPSYSFISLYMPILIDMYVLITMIEDFFKLFSVMHLLRRFLDKKYITNMIDYSGYEQSCRCIDVLVKDFDFRITHMSYINAPEIDVLNSMVRGSSFKELCKLLIPFSLNQCSNITKFPKNFM